MRRPTNLTNRSRSPRHGFAGTTALLLGAVLAPAADAGTTRTVCASGCGFATVQAAVDAAAAGDRVEIHETLHTEFGVVVDKDLEIVGVGDPKPTIQAASVPGIAVDRVFLVEPFVDLVIRDLTIRHGVSPSNLGGGIDNQGELILERVDLVQNEASLRGGGVFSSGSLEVRNSSVSFNSGGGIAANTGLLLVQGSEVRGNVASGDGGGIYSDTGDTVILSSEIRDNVSGLDGGGIWAGDGLVIRDSLVVDNVALQGGGIWTDDLEILNSLIEGNLAETGGGLHATFLRSINVVYTLNTASTGAGGGASMLKGSVLGGRFTGNSAAGSGGGLYATFLEGGRSVLVDGVVFESNTASGGGGLLFNVGGVVRDSLFVGNQATSTGGGFHLQCCLTEGFSAAVLNSTFSGNSAETGGGVYLAGAADFSNVTIANNVADPEGEGGINGGGLFVASAAGFMAVLRNSIIAGNSDPAPSNFPTVRAPDCAGAVMSDGFNSIGTLGSNVTFQPACEVSGLSVDVGGDQGLGPLADNGGPTWTHALLEGSPNVDTGDPNDCRDDLGVALSRDQRGARRVGVCDRGAFERGGEPPLFFGDFESGGTWRWSLNSP